MKLLAVVLTGIALLALCGALATFVIVKAIEARYPPNGRFVEVTGGRLHVIEMASQGPPPEATVLLLHGASGSAAEPLSALGERLARRFRVIAVDRPGSGWSDRVGGADAASPAAQARAIREAVEKLGIGRAVVVGHSWSGALALNLALDHADLVSALVLLAPVSHPWPGAGVSWYYGPTTSPVLGRLLTWTFTTPAGLLLMRPTLAAVFWPQRSPLDYADRARIPLVLRPRAFRANAEDVAGLYAFVTAQSRRYGEIRVPTVILSGDADGIVWTNLHSRSLEREIPGARLVVLRGVGHMPHHAAPDLVAGEIEALAAKGE
jgi:pimeloyl-ACP methyl ester carboxylesterase